MARRPIVASGPDLLAVFSLQSQETDFLAGMYYLELFVEFRFMPHTRRNMTIVLQRVRPGVRDLSGRR
jgi:hypothetical protein